MNEIISGVYEIRNTKNGHCYIGSSVNILKRWQLHLSLLNSGKHHSLYLQNAYSKYGKDAFSLFVIERCDRDSLIKLEQYYLDMLHPAYNMSPTASSVLGVKHTRQARRNMSAAQIGNKKSLGYKHTEETKRKMSLAQIGNKKALGRVVSPETREKISRGGKGKNAGRKLTQEHKDKISKSLIGNQRNKGKHPPRKSRERISLALRGNKNNVIVDDGMIKQIQELLRKGIVQKRIAEMFSIDQSTVSRIKNNKLARML